MPPIEAPLDAPPSTEEGSATSWVRRYRSWLRRAAWLLVFVAILLGTPRFVAQVAVIDSYSMIPALQEGDRVVIEKLTARFGSVGRGVVVVVANPELRSPTTNEVTAQASISVSAAAVPDHAELVLKRAVAVGGDAVEMRDNQLLVNDRAVAEPYLAPDVVTLDFGPVIVPAGHIFIVGDNRNASRDSRHYGPVAAGEVVGRVVFRLWPPSRWGTL